MLSFCYVWYGLSSYPIIFCPHFLHNLPIAPIHLANNGCPPGQGSVTPGANTKPGSCQPCIPGKFKDVFGDVACKNCPDGTSTNGQPGATSCTPCAPGSYSWNQYNGGAASCTLCRITTYQDKSGQVRCEGCNAGAYCPKEGMTAKLLCPPGTGTSKYDGTFNTQTGYTTCYNCPAGRYGPTNGTAFNCLACPQGELSISSIYVHTCSD